MSLAQALVILGEEEFLKWFNQEDLKSAQSKLEENGFALDYSYVSLMKRYLECAGFSTVVSEVYFRGGSISWMIFGDIDASVYQIPKNKKIRSELIWTAKKLLTINDDLKMLGEKGLCIPFPGARGIKFVIKDNDKERSARDLLKWSGIAPEHIVYAGNELFDGGNDNMLRNIEGINLFSVGEREDLNTPVIVGYEKSESEIVRGIEANDLMMNFVTKSLQSGNSWNLVVSNMRRKKYD